MYVWHAGLEIDSDARLGCDLGKGLDKRPEYCRYSKQLYTQNGNGIIIHISEQNWV